MQPSLITRIGSAARIEQLERAAIATEHRITRRHSPLAAVRGYFGHAGQAHEQSLRRQGRGTGGASSWPSREARSGRPALVLLGGDSGVGKTRLVAELERAARGARPSCAARGVEQGDGDLPYAPLLGALRPLVREHHPALES